MAHALSGPDGSNEAELRACAERYALSDLTLELDGESVSDLDSFYVSSPLFDFTVPANNIFNISPPGPGQGVAAGISAMIEPLSPGAHQLRFKARSGNDGFVDMTYLITVFTWPAVTIRPSPHAHLTQLSWTSPVDLSLQESDTLDGGAVWRPASLISSETTNSTRVVEVTAPSSTRFYRLSRP